MLDDVSRPSASAPRGRRRADRGAGYAVALGWTALTPGTTMDAVFAVDKADDSGRLPRRRADCSTCRRRTSSTPTSTGNIGYQAPGQDPDPAHGDADGAGPGDGTWPMPGWDSRYDWQPGYVPVDRLPWERTTRRKGSSSRPTRPSTPAGAGPALTHDFDYGYRSPADPRPAAGSDANGKLQVEDMQSMQLDTRNGIAADTGARAAARRRSRDPFTQEAVDLLKRLGLHRAGRLGAAAYFNAVWAALLQLTFDDELPAGTAAERRRPLGEVVRNLLQDRGRPLVGQPEHARRGRDPGRDPAPGAGQRPAPS